MVELILGDRLPYQPKYIIQGDKKKAKLQEEIASLKKELESVKALNEQIQKEKKLQEDVIDFFINRQKK